MFASFNDSTSLEIKTLLCVFVCASTHTHKFTYVSTLRLIPSTGLNVVNFLQLIQQLKISKTLGTVIFSSAFNMIPSDGNYSVTQTPNHGCALSNVDDPRHAQPISWQGATSKTASKSRQAGT